MKSFGPDHDPSYHTPNQQITTLPDKKCRLFLRVVTGEEGHLGEELNMLLHLHSKTSAKFLQNRTETREVNKNEMVNATNRGQANKSFMVPVVCLQSVADPKLFFSDPDPTWRQWLVITDPAPTLQVVSDPDPDPCRI